MNDVSLFDYQSGSVTHKQLPDFYCEGIGNQSVQTNDGYIGDGEVTALVKGGPLDENLLVSYKVSNHNINIIEKIGELTC